MRGSNTRWAVVLWGVLFLIGACRSLAATTSNAYPKLWFPVGETLMYRITWGIIPIGWSNVRSEWIEQNGETLLRIRYRARTNRVFDRLYPLNDTAEAIIDPVTFLPRTFTFASARRHMICDDIVTFHHETGVAVIESRCNFSEKLVTIPPDTRDILTFMYDQRRIPPVPHTEQALKVMTHEGLLDLKLLVHDRASIGLATYGRVTGILMEPEMNYDGLLIEDGRVKLWVSDDDRRLAMRLDIHAPLADVRATLCGVSGPGADRWVSPTAADACLDPDNPAR